MNQELIKKREALGIIANLFKEFNIGSLLNLANISKTKGATPLELFTIIFNLCFQGKNLFEGVIRNKWIKLNKRHIYGFLNNSHYNWRKLLFLLSTRIYLVFKGLNSNPYEEVLIVDDSPYDRSRSKFVELLAKVFDHNSSKFIKGFRTLTLGWSDGNSFLGLDFALLSSPKEENRYCEADSGIDQRSCGGIRRKEAIQKSTVVLPAMVKRALSITKVKLDGYFWIAGFHFPR